MRIARVIYVSAFAHSVLAAPPLISTTASRPGWQGAWGRARSSSTSSCVPSCPSSLIDVSTVYLSTVIVTVTEGVAFVFVPAATTVATTASLLSGIDAVANPSTDVLDTAAFSVMLPAVNATYIASSTAAFDVTSTSVTTPLVQTTVSITSSLVTQTAALGAAPAISTTSDTAVSSVGSALTSTDSNALSTAKAMGTVTAMATSTVTGYMSVVSKWRAAASLPVFTQDLQLQANALQTVRDSNGTMHHELNPGTGAQVLAPGNATNFEYVYVGGWLCEVANQTYLHGICDTMAQGWDHSSGETDHEKYLTSTSYTRIGCALYAGIWACDLA